MATRDRRGAMGIGLAVLNKLAGSAVLDRIGGRERVRRTVFAAARTGFVTAGAANRAFGAVSRLAGPVRPPASGGRDLFDLTPTGEQELVVSTMRDFAERRLRPVAAAAEDAGCPPADVLSAATELGITHVNVPEELGGAAEARSAVTNVLIAEALAHGDLALAVAILAPAAVANALVLFGDAGQQSAYLPAFVGDDPPPAAFAVAEPRVLFDALRPATKAYRTSDGFVLSGVKSLVPRVADDELFLVAAQLDGRGPALFLVESGTAGLTVAPDAGMGLRAAALGTLHLDGVRVGHTALLGGDRDGDGSVYAEAIRLARLGWCALAAGTARAVLDYVSGYVNERVAFGEPISHRQGVAFTVSTMATELEGLRLSTYRAAGRVDGGKPHAREVALARALAADKAMPIGSDGVQLLGGHGYVRDHPVERWYRDLRAVGFAEGVVLA